MVSLRNWGAVVGALAYGALLPGVLFSGETTLEGAVEILSASTGLAQSTDAPTVSRFCTKNTDNQDICGAINVPSGGSSDTFFQVRSSTSPGWGAIGVGNGMDGALIFVIYPSSDGRNVTVSPRVGGGHFEPEEDESIQIEMLDGSGVNNGIMTANFKCSNCRAWDGGELNAQSSNQNFIWATGPGTQIQSDDIDENIRQHSDKGNFRLNVASATSGDGSVNPFTASSSSGDGDSSSGNSDGLSSTGGASSASAPQTKADKVLIAHGVIMAFTWVILFPLGAAVIRLLNNRIHNPVGMHRALQIFNVCLAFIGLGLGIYTSDLNKTHFHSFHQYFGVILVGMLFVQGALGQLHHNEYKRIGKRSAWSYLHIWVGRIVILLAVVNCGTGLRLADASGGQVAAFVVIVLLIFVTYTAFYFIQRRKRRAGHQV